MARVGGAALLTLGLLVGGLTAYDLVGTGLLTERAQAAATSRLRQSWTGPDPGLQAVRGEPIARITIPRLGPDWGYTILEGTDETVLADGPGHYVGTPLPGEPGNVAVAGHRVGRGAPFDAIGTLAACDDVVIETRASVLTYRILPFTDGSPPCPGVPELDPAYARVLGREIVTPEDTAVLALVPGRPKARPRVTEPLLTLTTCHPRYSARQRLIVHAVLVAETTRAPSTA